jgi:hypothetical protein
MATETPDAGWNYGTRGWEWSNPETGSYLWAGLRFQPRYSNRVDDPLISEDLRQEGREGLSINRARYKIGAALGHHLTAYHEYDLRNGQLLDLRATWKPVPQFHLRFGQWKTEYNRERVDSSGKQQFVDRSIANYWFTLDRQNGVMASGRIQAERPGDSTWYLGLLNGNGINTGGDGGRPLLVGRWQWNFTRSVLPFSQSALQRYEPARGALAVGFAANDSPYTRFASSGGGQLPGYEQGADNQYRTEQLMVELAWQRRGTSLQGEAHYKTIEDRRAGGSNSLYGGYFQAGWFPAERYERWPSALELAARVAVVVPDDAISTFDNRELSFATNWFFNGHRNKLSADLSYLEITDVKGETDGFRFRLQWDISL